MNDDDKQLVAGVAHAALQSHLAGVFAALAEALACLGTEGSETRVQALYRCQRGLALGFETHAAFLEAAK